MKEFSPEDFEEKLRTDQLEEWLAMSNVFINNKRYRDCMPIYEYILMLDPENLRALNNYSDCLLNLAQSSFDKGLSIAENMIGKALDMDPDFSVARLTKSELLLKRFMVDEAMQELESICVSESEWTSHLHKEVLRIMRDPQFGTMDITRLDELLNE
jgi:tetratricopeptide (TPR) repeat protein